ncbi:hypothetical protein [Paracoccus sediminilitoris]|uniref:hypothetical protein n=1 Tax=Paracoccus sediminilitoris TaxID=2202419 RepID=UPI00272C6FF0|nr:hypothetical protein [Paracoccus sediminilitoris]
MPAVLGSLCHAAVARDGAVTPVGKEDCRKRGLREARTRSDGLEHPVTSLVDLLDVDLSAPSVCGSDHRKEAHMTTEKKPDSEQPAIKRENGQGKHEGVPHSPEEFDVMNPAKMKREPASDKPSE